MDTSQVMSGFFKLPREIRLMIYNFALENSIVKIGGDEINSKALTKWPQQPGICRASRLLRCETLEIYYSRASFQLNIQRPSGECQVLEWISSASRGMPSAFNNVRYVSIIAGLGYNDPPKEYRIDMQQRIIVSALRLCVPAYLYNYRGTSLLWSSLASGPLKRRLQRMPNSHCPDFDVAENLREVLATVGELSGYGLEGAPVHIEPPSVISASVINKSTPPSESRFLALPKELRLAIYEFTFTTDTEVIIGERDLRSQLLTDGPPSPGLLRTSSFIRREALSIYFACTHFVLNVQRILCEAGVLEWIRRCSLTYPEAFRSINVVSVIAGSGIRQPPHQYEFRLQKNQVLAVKNRRTYSPYTLPSQFWDPPLLEPVRQCLCRLPRKVQPEFDVVRNIQEVMEVLAK